MDTKTKFKLPAHFMVSETDGGLYDTRKRDWSHRAIRPGYRWTHGKIQTLKELKATLRAGAYTFPGGYPLFLITQDCVALCFKCARKEFKTIASSWNCSAGWRVIGCEINYENTSLACDHCSKAIEAAYGEGEEGEREAI